MGSAKTLKSNQDGAAAIIIALIISILFVTTTIVASRLSISELRDSTEIDISDQSYFAAEAGVEDALRRLDSDDSIPLPDLFPEMYDIGDNLIGDQAVLINSDGNRIDNINVDRQDDSEASIGQLAWRSRKVYESQVAPTGTQLKDETIEIDTSDLRRELPAETCGEDGFECDGTTPIHSNFVGISYCWNDLAPSSNAEMEFTLVSWNISDYTDVDVRKLVFNSGVPAATQNVGVGTFTKTNGGGSAYSDCVIFNKIDPSHSRRYILRTRPIYQGAPPSDRDRASAHRPFAVEYASEILATGAGGPPGSLQIADNAVLIDVIGQDGDIRRRLIVKKERKGKLLGVFDFVIYSGDPVLPLCKAGVQQASGPDDLYSSDCIANPLVN